MADASLPRGRHPPWLARARASCLLELLGYEAALASGLAGAVGLWARHTPWPWAAVAVPEMAPWVALPAVLGGLLAGTARGVWCGASPRPVLASAAIALALAGWPLAVLSVTASRFHQAMRQALGTSYAAGLTTPSGATLRPTPFSPRDFANGILLGQSRVVPD